MGKQSLKQRRDKGEVLVPPAPPVPKRRGKPTRCTPELTEEIATHVRDIGYLAIAAELCGVHRVSAYEWQQKGLAGEAEYVDFAQAVKVARAEWTAAHIRRVERSEWILERADPSLFGPKAEPPVAVNVVNVQLTREQALEELARRAADDPGIRAALTPKDGPR